MIVRKRPRVQSSYFPILVVAVAVSAGYACNGRLGDGNGVNDHASCSDCAPGNGRTTGPTLTPVGLTAGSPQGAGDPNTPHGVGWSTRFPKLSNKQWENTVKDLFYLDTPSGYSSEFIQEPADQGFESEAAAKATISGDLWGRYQSAAEKVADLITHDDAKIAKILPSGLPSSLDDKAAAFVKAFGRRVYRHPLTAQQVADYVALFKQGATLVGGDAFKAGVSLTIQTMLQSPYFLYRAEASSETKIDRVWLSSYEVASRLSYALWNTTPPDDLLDTAERDELSTPEGVRSWAEKMLKDPRANETLISFHQQFFATNEYGSQDKDPSLSFDAKALTPVLQEEAHSFFEDIVIQQNGGIRQLLTTPVAYVNEDTAKFYELSGVQGKSLQRAQLDPQRRAGFLTQVGYLSRNAARDMTDPVHRGLGVLRKVLCDEPNPPPMMFQPPMPESGKTTRQIYEKKTACGVGCHDTLINPPGFAFEHFDAVGKWRDTEKGLPLDTKATLAIRTGWTPDEKKMNPATPITFDGAVDLSKQLSDLPRTHECYARRFMEFVLNRPVDSVERGAGEALRQQSITTGSAREIILTLVTLDTFRSRVPDGP